MGMTREKLAAVLEEIALLLELKGENPFKVRAYRTGAEIVQSYPGDIVKAAAENQLAGTKGIGEALRDKLHELATTGKLAFHEKLRAEFPETIFEVVAIPGLGPKKVKALYDALGIDSVARLRAACEAGEVAGLAGFGQRSVDRILEAIAFREQNATRFRQEEVVGVADMVLEFLKALPEVSRAQVAGSWRRGKETVHDLDFIAETRDTAAVTAAFVGAPFVVDVIASGATKASIHVERGIQCDLRAVAPAEYPFALNYFTGSKEHNVSLRGRALSRGYTLNEYRLAATEAAPDADGIRTEEDLYRFLGLDYIVPELRENGGEIEAAEAGELPRLVELENLRGTFHCHTVASDGRATLEEMAEAARELGMQYLGIADHSRSSFQANGLDAERLLAQVAEIRALNAQFEGFRLFAGSEVDILKDGDLDFDDEVLSQLDYCVASVHNALGQEEAKMTDRIIRAISNPHVTMLGHLTGRLLLRREPSAVDIPAVIEACADTGTIIELNANPWRLDMDWRWWKLAKERGVKCAINPDAHDPSGFDYLFYGIRIARKGWLTRQDVVNCLPLGEVEAAIGVEG
jgi:DNA polymerase (family 10)